MRIEGTLDELRDGVRVPLDETTTIVLLPSATVHVQTAAGEPVADEPVLVKRADGRVEKGFTNAQGNLYLYGKRDEVFNVTLMGRPKGEQGSASNPGGDAPCATLFVNATDGTAVANEEVLVERADGTRETYYTNGQGQVRLFGKPDEALKVCLPKQLKGSVSVKA